MSNQEIQVEKTESCPSLSGSNTITYETGTLADKQYIRLLSNDGGGLFCKDWIAMADIKKLIGGIAKVTSKTIQPIYAGKSTNSPGFLRACLINEKIIPAVQPTEPPIKKKSRKSSSADGRQPC